MVGSNKMIHVGFGTLLDAEVNTILEIPGGRVTRQLSPILGPLDDASLPEGLWHRREAHGQEEILGLVKHDLRSPALLHHGIGDIQGWLLGVWCEDACNLGPRCTPWVPQQMGRDWSLWVNDVLSISELKTRQ